MAGGSGFPPRDRERERIGCQPGRTTHFLPTDPHRQGLDRGVFGPADLQGPSSARSAAWVLLFSRRGIGDGLPKIDSGVEAETQRAAGSRSGGQKEPYCVSLCGSG